MDTVDYTGANVRLMKGIQHLPNWQLIIPLLLLTSYTACDISTPSSVPDSSDQNMTVATCIGGTASFTWSYEVQPFLAIEWFFGDKPIADTTVKSFSKDDISITPNYTYRFHLQTAGKVGFSLTDVTKNDTGTYSCVVTLESTHISKEFTAQLQVKGATGATGSRRKRATSGVDGQLSCDADEQPHASDPSTDATIGIAVPSCIVGIGVVVIVIKRKRNSRTEQGSAGPDGNSSEETIPESHKLAGHEDQTSDPERSGFT
ncbi:uncharacterized protein LOC124124606 isoform X2 [Haliotis rufescens]|uniref:uncharacterized protein LOC124124606 isoform X2 n=1 Tax=Haliotis rufescens TaxID=6454 RepID=UPI00201F2D4C|nr:uncharacterized protein LOC124124606 isoform X2 [Haliotis rufescens]